MKIAILCTSNDTSDFAKRFITDDQKYINLLKPLRPDWEYECFVVWQDEFPSDINQYEGVIITGSPASVNGDDEWISKLLDLIKLIHRRKIKLFGGCFGHQAIAAALGGLVEFNRNGKWSVGTETTQFANTPQYFQEKSPQLNLYSIHKEEVTSLPKNAQVIGSSNTCENASFIIGDHIFTSQYHPEMTSDFLIDLVEEMRGEVNNAILEDALIDFKNPHDGTAFAELLVLFFEYIKK